MFCGIPFTSLAAWFIPAIFSDEAGQKLPSASMYNAKFINNEMRWD